jgi:mannosyltransferase OCH1-like enzyme
MPLVRPDPSEARRRLPGPAERIMIPKILHVLWVGPHNPPMELISTWETKHTDGWFFILWRDHTAGWVNQDQIQARAARREWNGVADVMRYEILHQHGGFAVDADSECLKPLSDGPEDFLNNDTAVACYESESVRPGMIGCGFLGAPKQHPFFEACVAECAVQDPREAAWKTVGPLLMGRVARRMPEALRVYPARTFNPVHYSGAVAPGDGPIYAKQHWGSTKGYGALRKMPCWCDECRITMLRPPWG